jgi:multiple sugar transport system substrate-binding protein
MPKLRPNRKTIFGVGAHPILKQSNHPEEAWTFLKFASSRKAMAYSTKIGYSNPARRSVANDPKLMAPAYNPHENWHVYYDALSAAEALPAPPQFNEMESALVTVYSRMIANEITPAQMMKTLDPQINSILAKPV